MKLPRNVKLQNTRSTTIAISFSPDKGLRFSYSEEVANHLGGTGTMLDFDQVGSLICISPTQTTAKNLPAVRKASEKATVDYQSSTTRLDVTGHEQGMTTLDATLTMRDGRPVVLINLPSNLKVPSAPKHEFEGQTPEAILAHIRADLVEAEKHGLSDWELAEGKLYAAIRQRIG